MQQYLQLMRHVREKGVFKEDRTGTGTYSVFGYQMRFDLAQGFPALTTKKLHLRSIIHELLWFLSGQSIDQVKAVLESLKNNPDSRRHIINAWNVACIDQMALPPCHMLFQFYVSEGRLSCQLYQRSADIFLGVPFNIGSYALLTMMVAQVLDLEVGDFVHTLGDAHLYKNHLEQVDLQLQRTPLHLPKMTINPDIKDLFAFTYDDFELSDYEHHPHIAAPVAV